MDVSGFACVDKALTGACGFCYLLVRRERFAPILLGQEKLTLWLERLALALKLCFFAVAHGPLAWRLGVKR